MQCLSLLGLIIKTDWNFHIHLLKSNLPLCFQLKICCRRLFNSRVEFLSKYMQRCKEDQDFRCVCGTW